MKKEGFTIILFYKFAKINNPAKFRDEHKKLAAGFALKGRMLVAKEGINATFEGTNNNIKAYMRAVKKIPLFKGIVFKQSEGHGLGFTKLQVKVRPEVVTLGVGELNIKKDTAKTITATQLEKMYEAASAKGSGAPKDDFVVLDLRNDFEVEAGYFEKTVNPRLKFFRDLPGKINELAHLKDKKVVAVCTGGIRCEKATVLLKKEGFTNLYQLKDGIHTYIKKYPGKRFKGSLFVFDNRIVTPVVETEDRTIVGTCKYCGVVCEQFYNDDSIRPSRKVICCDNCIVRHNKLRPAIPV